MWIYKFFLKQKNLRRELLFCFLKMDHMAQHGGLKGGGVNDRGS